MTNRPTAKQVAARGLILQAQVGSRVHGTSVGGDDRDEMGICVEPQDHVMGLYHFDQYIFRTAQERTGDANARSEAGDLDLTVYGLRKFVRLASAGNPSILTLLYSPEDMITFANPIGWGLVANHDMFHHRGVAARFLGYIEAQRQRMTGQRSQTTNRPELIEAYGFDCYLDDTEFLTRTGWKRYDEIADGEQVGTVNQGSGQVEFQVPTERVDKAYSGPIHFIRHRYSSCAVTPNHRMWTSPVNRGPSDRIGNVYRPEVARWGFSPAAELRKNHHVRVAGSPRTEEYPVEDAFLSLVGAYVSEGHVAKRLDSGTASVLGFSQNVGGRLEPVMAAVGSLYPLKRYTYTREDGGRKKPCHYTMYTLADRDVAPRVEELCGSGSAAKGLPEWSSRLSARQAEVLLSALMAGDGTTTRLGYQVYYTISPKLAGDVQALALLAGRRSNLWGPYDTGMYQVMVQEPGREFETLKVADNVRVEDVTDRRIVCFTVPNETLVTRREGRVAMHGNTKYAGHIVRLALQGVEYMTTGRMNLPMAEPWRSWICDLRLGKHTEQEALEVCADFENQLKVLRDTADMPEHVDMDRINKWLVTAHHMAWTEAL